MSTWGTLLADIRIDLKDAGTTKRWSDEIIFLFAKDAIRAYSVDLPMQVYREVLTAANGSFALPSQYTGIISVESSEGVYLARYEPLQGKRIKLPSEARSYYVSGYVLYLDVTPSDGDTILFSYKKSHDVPTSKDDTTKAMTYPAEDEEIIRLFVKAKVAEQMRLAQSGLDRFKPGSGSRDDNPLMPEHDELMGEFRRRIAERSGGIIHLNRTGRFS